MALDLWQNGIFLLILTPIILFFRREGIFVIMTVKSLAQKLLEEVNSSWIAQAVYVTAELQIAELLAEGPKTSDELAQRIDVHAVSLYRLMRSLTTIDICSELDDGSFELTEMGKRLQADHPESMRSWVIWWATNLWQSWGHLLQSVKTGESARKMLEGIEGFSHLDDDPKQAEVFNQALVEITRPVAIHVIKNGSTRNRVG